MKIRLLVLASNVPAFLIFATNAFAQTATGSSKGGTSSSLPSAGTTEITYLLFLVGLFLFVVGTLKLISSFHD